MADLIQFPCPVCFTTLRLPLEMAGSQGPCPRCGADIIAPDPYRGTGASVPAPPPEPPRVEPFKPFLETPAIVLPFTPDPAEASEVPPPIFPSESAKQVQADPPGEVAANPQIHSNSEASSRRAVFVLSLLLTAVVSLVAGYLLGARSNWLISRTPYPVMEPTTSITEEIPPVEPPVWVKPAGKPVATESSPPVEPVRPEPTPPQAEPPAPIEPAKSPEPKKASAMAEAALKAFLDAPDWTTRCAHVLHPDKVRSSMEDYSRKHPDGATTFQSVSIENSYTDKTTGNTLFIFKVVTELLPSGFPVAVAETSTGWNVDWKTFVEFRDDHFKVFADGPPGKSGRFHLIVSRPAAPRATNTDNEHFSSFILDPPLPGRQKIAYAKKTTEVHEKLTAATANGAICTPVLELEKRSTPDGKSYLEIVAVTATDWLPENE